jgi:hypothetical protein
MPLYGMVWLVLATFLTAMVLPPGAAASALHAGFGIGVVLLAFINVRNLEPTRAPLRTKRIARASLSIAVVGAAAGGLLQAGFAPSFGILDGGWVKLIHVLAAAAVFTQAASVATSYDMWEERESTDSEAGRAPARPRPTGHSRAF